MRVSYLVKVKITIDYIRICFKSLMLKISVYPTYTCGCTSTFMTSPPIDFWVDDDKLSFLSLE